MRRHVTSSLMVVAAVVLLATGCLGGKSKKNATVTSASASPVTAESVLSSASQQWSQTNTAHFQLSIEGNAFLDVGADVEIGVCRR